MEPEQPAAETPTNEVKTPVPDGLPVGQPQALPTASVPDGLPVGQPQVVQTLPTIPAAADTQIIEERGEVSALYIGRVIGKGGEMIRDLQARSACRMDVDQNVPPGAPRVITYRGTREKVEFAKQLVQILCREGATDADLPLGEAKREYLVVPAQSVGKIIGRGGEMIRELQSRSQAKIQVDHNGQSGLNSDEKQVTITGTELAVAKGTEMVLFLVANPMVDAMQSISMLVEDKSRGGVWGSGPPYPNLPNQGQNMQQHQVGGGNGYDQQYGGGYQQQNAYGQQNAYAAAAPMYQQQQGSYGQYGNQGGDQMEIFYAAKNFMGRIIGQKGVTINDLQRRSTCDIQINQDVPPGQDCEISIRGSRQGIEMAKQMLREIIEIGPNHPYAGGNGGGYGGYGQQNQNNYGYQQQQQASYGHQGYGQSAYGHQGGYQTQAYQQPQTAQYQGSYGAPNVPAPPPPSLWKSATAPDGQIYYYNERTGETQWEKPIGMP